MANKPVPTHKHVLTFEGQLPADEMHRAQVFASNPAIAEHRAGLEKALATAGYPHTSNSHVIRPRSTTTASVQTTEADPAL